MVTKGTDMRDTAETQSVALGHLLGTGEGSDSYIQELKPEELTRSLKERARSPNKVAGKQMCKADLGRIAGTERQN